MRAPAVLFSVVVLLLVGCGSDDSQATAESVDEPDGAAAEGGPASDPLDFCEAMMEVTTERETAVGEDPEDALEVARQVRELAASAPTEVAGALEVFAGMLESLVAFEDPGDDMEALGEMMDLILDPEVLEAAATIEDHMVEECGMDPVEAAEIFGVTGSDDEGIASDAGDDPTGGEGGGGEESADPSGIDLEDVDAVEAAHAGEAWVDKVISTGISNDRFVSLSADGAGAGIGDGPMTTDEAIEGCDAVRLAFEDRQPELVVEMYNGDTLVAEGAAGLPCTAA